MSRLSVPEVSILVVDDEVTNVGLLVKILQRAGYANIASTSQSREVLEIAARHHPDIVLLDLHMPELDGLEVMRVLRAIPDLIFPYVVILTGDDTPDAKQRALSSGAKDFITKPFDASEVILRINNLADLRAMHKQLHQHNLSLEEKVRARTAELERARLDVIERLGMAAEFRDDATGQHTRRVGMTSAAIARALNLPERTVEVIERAAPLHDVGKIAVPDRILLKPGPLDEDEMQVMRTHTTIGARLLGSSGSMLLDVACEIALSHHERWDGEGYPGGLSATAIPLSGRIVALADFFDALSHDRPYRRSIPRDVILNTIDAECGRHFDPDVYAAFRSIVDTLPHENFS